MICPICHPNQLCGFGPATITPCEAHQEPGSMALDEQYAFTSLETFDPEQLNLAVYLNTILPIEFHVLLEKCRAAAIAAYTGFRDLIALYADRYRAMCPEPSNPDGSGSDGVRFYMHAASLDHLLNWPGLDIVEGPVAGASVAKIPAEILSFYVEKEAYEAYVKRFDRLVEEYVDGLYGEYLRAKVEMEDAVEKSDMADMDVRMWRLFWEDGFLNENDKWEADLVDLALPTWDEIVDELYQAILERVEGAEDLALLIRTCEELEAKAKERDEGENEGSFPSVDGVHGILGEGFESIEILEGGLIEE